MRDFMSSVYAFEVQVDVFVEGKCDGDGAYCDRAITIVDFLFIVCLTCLPGPKRVNGRVDWR